MKINPIIPPTSPEQRYDERTQLYKLLGFLGRNASTILMLAGVITAGVAEQWEAAQVIVLLMLWLKIDDIRVSITVEKGSDDE